MTTETTPRQAWNKPQITRLGEIKDVAGNQTPLAQSVGNVKS
ncbi:MAG: hypothetical protein ABIN68_03825 [Sphingomicrobium sp.]